MLLVALVAVALIFDFLNGLHDAANSIATVVSTRVLSPNVAVVWAAFFNFVAFLFFGLHVAQTVGTGIISPDIVDGQVIFGALMGAIVWNLLTWWGAIPSSSSHALIGGLIGAGAAKAGFSAVVWWGTLKTVAAMVWSPLLGFALALLLWLVVAWLLVRSTPYTVDQKFRVLQLGSAAHHTPRRGADRGSVLRVRGPFCCGRLTPFGGCLTRQPRHISAGLFYDRRSGGNPYAVPTRARGVARVPGPGSIAK
jgi:PiT family inorganic phosphate transporter